MRFWGFSPLWVRICIRKSPAWVNNLLHSLHLCGFSPLWISKCFFRFPAWRNVLLHFAQACIFLPVWIKEFWVENIKKNIIMFFLYFQLKAQNTSLYIQIYWNVFTNSFLNQIFVNSGIHTIELFKNVLLDLRNLSRDNFRQGLPPSDVQPGQWSEQKDIHRSPDAASNRDQLFHLHFKVDGWVNCKSLTSIKPE